MCQTNLRNQRKSHKIKTNQHENNNQNKQQVNLTFQPSIPIQYEIKQEMNLQVSVNPSIFFKGIEPKEEEELISKLSEEDNLKTRQILVERNLRLVVYIAKKFENTGIGIEDLISIGTIGLMKGVNTFNSDKNIKLATYSSRCIENEILMYLRKNNKIKGEVSIDEPLNKDCDGNELLLSDILGTDPDITSRNIEDEVDKTLLRASILKLNERERNIMEMRFGFNTGKEKTQKEVADELRNITKLYFKIRKKDNQ